MKKGLSLFLSVILIAVSFCACSMIKDPDAVSKYTYVDENGVTHQYATDAKGEVATEKGGVPATTASTSGKSNQANKNNSSSTSQFAIYATDKEGNNVTDKNGELVTSQLNVEELLSNLNNTTTTKKGQTNNNSGGLGSNLENSDKDDLLEEGDKTNKTSLKSKIIDPVIKSNKYTLDMVIVAQGMEMPMVMCINGKEYAASISLNMGTLKIDARVFSQNGKYFIVIPMLGMYSEINEEDSSDITGATGNLTDDAKYVKSTKVKDGKTTYTCEEYKNKNGDTIKYYFNEKNEWKRWEIIDKDDNISVFKINSLKNSVDKKMFEVPKYLTKVDYDKFIGA